MLKIRLARQGSGNNKFYRVVVVDKVSKRNGQALETLGYWHPSREYKKIDIKKIEAWVLKGAKVSPAVSELTKK